ncbi:putative inner membrane protein [Proteus penneri ATCC 35198]|nr:putative inner membrane protein [Proteus penneri ATCC 35198]
MSWSEFKSQYLIRFWKPLPAVIAAGILSTYYFGLTGTFLGCHGRIYSLGRSRNAMVWCSS